MDRAHNKGAKMTAPTTTLEATASTAEIRTALQALQPGGPAAKLEDIDGQEPWTARRLEDGTWRLQQEPDEDGDAGRPLDASDLETAIALAGGNPGGPDDVHPSYAPVKTVPGVLKGKVKKGRTL